MASKRITRTLIECCFHAASEFEAHFPLVLVIEIGTTSQCDVVVSLEDDILEHDEVIEVTVSSITPVIVITTTAFIHIGNDDGKITQEASLFQKYIPKFTDVTSYVEMCFFTLFAVGYQLY